MASFSLPWPPYLLLVVPGMGSSDDETVTSNDEVLAPGDEALASHGDTVTSDELLSIDISRRKKEAHSAFVLLARGEGRITFVLLARGRRGRRRGGSWS